MSRSWEEGDGLLSRCLLHYSDCHSLQIHSPDDQHYILDPRQGIPDVQRFIRKIGLRSQSTVRCGRPPRVGSPGRRKSLKALEIQDRVHRENRRCERWSRRDGNGRPGADPRGELVRERRYVLVSGAFALLLETLGLRQLRERRMGIVGGCRSLPIPCANGAWAPAAPSVLRSLICCHL